MYLAIDIGGTKTLLALFTRHGHCIKRFKYPTNHNQTQFLNELSINLQPFRRAKIKTVVVAIPGIVQENYTFKFGNLNWPNIDLYSPIKNLFNCPIFFVNDADLATFYESKGRSGKTIYLTFSTGIGGGIVENGKLSHESAKFEPGHWQYTYNDETLEWEDIAAVSAIRRVYDLPDIIKLRGKKAYEDVAKRVCLGLTDIIRNYHPDTIVVGGPLGLVFNKIYPYFKFPDSLVYHPRVVKAKRPTESVIYGCYLYAKSKA